ncbi:MAG TPA: hypothetical protein VK564_08395 [Thermodesulfobacteriota bacterium]|nr:hypothetical protein [Thermodesulfobacteriota bacterium]
MKKTMPMEISAENEALKPGIIAEILPTIRRNCLIADARHSGLYSLCGLFLRMKDLYNWEQGNPPWSPTREEHLIQWIDTKETNWLGCLDEPYEPIVLESRSVDCLDSPKVNRHLFPLGYYYGAGYGRGMTPTFFLGVIRDQFRLKNFEVIILDRELALDLSLVPAQRQGRVIVIRREPLRFFLWAKIQETEQWEREATSMALAYYGWKPDRPPEEQLEPILEAEAETILYHELGEALDRTLPRGLWKKLLQKFPFSRIELYLRTLKDLLGDTHPQGTLQHIIQKEKSGSLAFYLSNLKGLRRSLFPEIATGVKKFKSNQDWEDIRRAAREGRRRMILQSRRIVSMAEEYLPERENEFTERFDLEFFKPLGL